MIDYNCKLATCKCQEPRRHAPGKQLRRHTHKYTAYVPLKMLHLRCILMSVSKPVTAEFSFVARMASRQGHWVGWSEAWWMSMVGKNMWLKWQQRDGYLGHVKSHRYQH